MTAVAERQLRAPLPAGAEPGLRLCFGVIKVGGSVCWLLLGLGRGGQGSVHVIVGMYGGRPLTAVGRLTPDLFWGVVAFPKNTNKKQTARAAQDAVREGDGAGGHGPPARYH